MAPRSSVLAALVVTLIAASGCEVTTTGPGAPEQPSGAGDKATALDALVVAESRSMRGYSREKFPHWRDAGENCDVRDTVLKRDGDKVKFSGCNVVAGTWDSSSTSPCARENHL